MCTIQHPWGLEPNIALWNERGGAACLKRAACCEPFVFGIVQKFAAMAGASCATAVCLGVQALQARGHTVVPVAWSGVVQSILVDPVDDVLTAVSDPRKDGAPAGY